MRLCQGRVGTSQRCACSDTDTNPANKEDVESHQGCLIEYEHKIDILQAQITVYRDEVEEGRAKIKTWDQRLDALETEARDVHDLIALVRGMWTPGKELPTLDTEFLQAGDDTTVRSIPR